MLGDVWLGLSYGLRMLGENPGFTAIIVLTVVLGIGANTAIFSVIDAALLKMLPVERPEDLLFINNVGLRGGGGAPPYPCVERFRENTHYLTDIASFSTAQMKFDIDGQVEEVNGQFVSGN